MNLRLMIKSLCIIILTMLILVGCTPGETDKDIVITFDGEGCTYDGPSVVSEGKRIITLKNNSGREVFLDVTRLDEGKTWQDVLDHFGEVGPGLWPPWLSYGIVIGILPDNPEAKEYTLTEGMYSIICWSSSPPGNWPAAPLEVRAE